MTINTTPEQRVIAENGTYSFVVPPGTYVIRAYYYSHGELELYDEENVTVKGNGTYVLDLILFPYLSNISEEIPKIQVSLGRGERNSQFPVVLVAFLVVLASVFGVWYFGKGRLRKREEVIAESKDEEEMPEDLRRAVEIIKKEGGRITQKELRKRLGYSEAKVSLIIADLERRGIVEKVRKGRGNIIFLKE